MMCPCFHVGIRLCTEGLDVLRPAVPQFQYRLVGLVASAMCYVPIDGFQHQGARQPTTPQIASRTSEPRETCVASIVQPARGLTSARAFLPHVMSSLAPQCGRRCKESQCCEACGVRRPCPSSSSARRKCRVGQWGASRCRRESPMLCVVRVAVAAGLHPCWCGRAGIGGVCPARLCDSWPRASHRDPLLHPGAAGPQRSNVSGAWPPFLQSRRWRLLVSSRSCRWQARKRSLDHMLRRRLAARRVARATLRFSLPFGNSASRRLNSWSRPAREISPVSLGKVSSARCSRNLAHDPLPVGIYPENNYGPGPWRREYIRWRCCAGPCERLASVRIRN